MEFFYEILSFLKSRKKVWIIPVLLCMFLFATLLFLAEGSVVAPFIYTLF